MNEESYVHQTEPSQILTENNATKRTLTSLWTSLEKKGIDVNQIKKNIADTCGRTMEMYGPLIDQAFLAASNLKTVNGLPFQVLGFDVLIDKDLKVWLLEINHSPSLNIYFENNKNPLEKVEPTEDDIC